MATKWPTKATKKKHIKGTLVLRDFLGLCWEPFGVKMESKKGPDQIFVVDFQDQTKFLWLIFRWNSYGRTKSKQS